MYGRGRYRSVVDVIMYDMTPTQQRMLAESVNTIIAEIRIEDFTILLPLILNNASVKELVLREIVTFIQNEMRMSVAA